MPRTAALLGMLMSLGPLACATTVYPGLANVPALGTGPAADASVHDVVANGRDSCERGLGPGPLRYQIPPCPGVERPAAGPTVVANRAPSAKGIVMPWVEHYYSRWPCSSRENEADRMTLARLASPYAASDRNKLSRLNCAMPL
jgi:hypothetical protein